VLRLFAVDCARRALARIPHPDPRSVAACDVAERYACGQATAEELRLAASAAADAAYTAVYTAAAAAYTAAAAAYTAADADTVRSKERKIQITRLICIIEEQEKA
jgi:hypothetical protein